MWRRLRVFIAVGLLLAGLAGWAVFLTGQGLEDANRWATVVGFFVSTVLAVVAVVLAWQPLHRPAPAPSVPVPGAGGVAVGGDNSGRVSTTVTGPPPPTGPGTTGSGSVSIGGTNQAPVTTRITTTGPGPADRP